MRMYGVWWWAMIKRWWWFVGVVGAIQVAWWFVPTEIAQQYEIWVRRASWLILIVPLLVWIPYKIWRQAKPELIKDQEKNPQSYISLHICSIDSSPLEVSQLQREQGGFVYLTICFCSALFHDIKLTRLTGSAQINDEVDRALFAELTSIQIKRGFTILGKCQLSATRELQMNLAGYTKRPTRLKLDLTGYDEKNVEYLWSATFGG